MCSRSVASDSLRPHGLQPATLLYPWGFFRQEYWSGLPPQGIFPIQGSNSGLPHCRRILYHLIHQASLKLCLDKTKISFKTKSISLLSESQRGRLSSVLLNPGTSSQPDSQWADCKQKWCRQRRDLTLTASSSVSWSAGGSLQASQVPVSPEPLRGEDCMSPSAGKEDGQSEKGIYRWERTGRKKICQLKDNTVLLVEIHTVMS